MLKINGLTLELELKWRLLFWGRGTDYLSSWSDIFFCILYFCWISIEKAKKEALRTAIRVSDLLVKVVDGGVHEIFLNEKRIKVEIQALAATLVRFSKQTDQWLAVSHAINTAVKVSGLIVYTLLPFLPFAVLLCYTNKHWFLQCLSWFEPFSLERVIKKVTHC